MIYFLKITRSMKEAHEWNNNNAILLRINCSAETVTSLPINPYQFTWYPCRYLVYFFGFFCYNLALTMDIGVLRVWHKEMIYTGFHFSFMLFFGGFFWFCWHWSEILLGNFICLYIYCCNKWYTIPIRMHNKIQNGHVNAYLKIHLSFTVLFNFH